jgi:hypothetical protein
MYLLYTKQYHVHNNLGICFGHLEQVLTELSILYDKVEIEECIYDSNELIDKDWIWKSQ